MAGLPESLDELIVIIEDASNPQENRIRAVSMVGDLASRVPDVRGILTLLDRVKLDQDPRLIAHCVSVLSRIKAYSAVTVLVDLLLASGVAVFDEPVEPDFSEGAEALRIRTSAAQALGRLGDDRAIIPLMSILNNRDENYRLRLACAETLGKLGHEQAVTPLIEILTDEREKSVYLRESAAKALGMLGDIRAIEPLIDALEAKRGIREKFDFFKEQIIEAIARIGKADNKATDTLLSALDDPAPSIRIAALEALEELGDQTCLLNIMPLISDRNDDVAVAAISAAYYLGGESVLHQLLAQDNLPQFLRAEVMSYLDE